MPITEGAAGAKLVLRTFKYHVNRPDTKWVNNYEFVTTAAWTASDLILVAAEFAVFEQTFHSEATRFDRWTFSTWAADSVPYDPEAFLAGLWPTNMVGSVPGSSTGEITPLDITAWVARTVQTGRQGKLFYRNVVGELQTSAPAGVPIISSAGLATTIENAKTNIGQYLGVGEPVEGGAPLLMALISKTGQVRIVQDLVLRGAAVNKRDRQYFDRT